MPVGAPVREYAARDLDDCDTGPRTFRRAMISLASIAFGVTVLIAMAFVAGAQETTDTYEAIEMRAFLAKRADITTTLVIPCKASQEAVIQPAVQHYTTCDCFPKEDDRQAALADLRLAEQRALGQCELNGLDAQLSYINRREAAVRDGLRDMVRKFQAQTSSFESLGSDAAEGKSEAEKKIGEMIISNGVGAMVDTIVDTNTEEEAKRIEEMIAHAKSVNVVRSVRTGELEDVVKAMKSELTGKSKDEAKQIVLSKLRAAQKSIKDVAALDKQLSERIVNVSIPRDDEPSSEERTQAYLTGGYAALLTDIKIMANHGVTGVKALEPATGVLALAPDGIDAAAILYKASALGDNLSGLEQLRAAAERQRIVYMAEMSVLVDEHHAIDAERARTKQAAAL